MEGNKSHIITARERYSRQLKSSSWFQKRDKVLERDQHTCQCCGSNSNLQVHHKQYHAKKSDGSWFAPWAYDDKYLITLCESCHQKGHSLYQIPVFKV